MNSSLIFITSHRLVSEGTTSLIDTQSAERMPTQGVVFQSYVVSTLNMLRKFEQCESMARKLADRADRCSEYGPRGTNVLIRR